MATTTTSNGVNHTNTATSGGKVQFDPNFTANVVKAMGPKTSPRMRTVMSKLIPHLHDFAREVELTVDEWMEGVMLMAWAGQMTNDRRNEVQLVCDVVGLESLVDEITYKKAAEAEGAATESAILGPFFRHDRPTRKNGESIHITKGEGAVDVYMYGKVVDNRTGLPLVGASVDLWQASTNGLYEQQDAAQVEHNLRGKFVTDENGEYACYLIKPTPYPVPFDGPAGKLLQLMDRHPYRPAHIHIIAQKEGYEPLTTQIYDSESDYLDNDSVFAVKDSLVVKFDPRPNDPQASWELHYDVRLAPSDPAKSRL